MDTHVFFVVFLMLFHEALMTKSTFAYLPKKRNCSLHSCLPCCVYVCVFVRERERVRVCKRRRGMSSTTCPVPPLSLIDGQVSVGAARRRGKNERTSWRPEPKAGWKLDWGENSIYNIPFPIWQHSSITLIVNMFSLFVVFFLPW